MRVGARYQGPPGAANGGWIAGLLAGEGPARVTIRRPVPVEQDLDFDGASLRGGPGAEVLAEVEALDGVDVGEVPRISFHAAREAAAATPLAANHPFPGCFACGPDHPTGLHCLTGPVGDGAAWAVTWTPEDGSAPFVWAALDCASSGPVVSPTGLPPYVLGRIEARVGRLVAGEPHVVVAWPLGVDGRRRFGASAVLDADDGVRAVARATWFALGGEAP